MKAPNTSGMVMGPAAGTSLLNPIAEQDMRICVDLQDLHGGTISRSFGEFVCNCARLFHRLLYTVMVLATVESWNFFGVFVALVAETVELWVG